MDPSVLVGHIISQTRQNVEFLISQNQISHGDGREILAKLPLSSSSANADASILALSSQASRLIITPPNSNSGPPSSYSNTGPSSYNSSYSAPPPPPRSVRAKALWGYNEQGQDPNDLSFSTGDIIEIVNETNNDWWTGRYKGREGLFPSNYVEKLSGSGGPPPPPSNPYSEKAQAPMPSYSHAPSYAPPYRPGGGYAPPPGPPPGTMYNPYGHPPPMQAPPPAAAPAPAPAPAPAAPETPSKLGSLGNTLAHSAAGGVGFGAGSAVGSGIINSIF